MGYTDTFIIKDRSQAEVASLARANLALFRESAFSDFAKEGLYCYVYQGKGCSFMQMGHMAHEDRIFGLVPVQLGAVFAIVREQDGDSWQVSLYDRLEHIVTQNVNPWAFEPSPQTSEKDETYRASRFADKWGMPVADIQGYFRYWRKKTALKWTKRTGKAYPDDEHGYGDSLQSCDFMRRLGASLPAKAEVIKLTDKG